MTPRRRSGAPRPRRALAGPAAALSVVLLLAASAPRAIVRAGAGTGDPPHPLVSASNGVSIAGMTLEIRQGRLLVTRLEADSQAARAGLMEGDAVLVVDDFKLIDLDPISPEAALGLFERGRRDDIRIIVGRGAGTLGVHLSLPDRELPPTPRRPPDEPLHVGSEAPDFTARDLEGHAISLRGLHGRPVLIDFWAAWCPPCRDQAIPLRRLAQEYGDRLAILGVSLDADSKVFEAFVYNLHLPGRQILDGGWSGPIGRLYGVSSTGIPFAVLIDASGRIVSTGNALQDLEEKLATLLRSATPAH